MPVLLRVTRPSSLRYSVGILCIAAALLVLWPDLAGNLFASGFGAEMFMPHGHCYMWVPSLVVLHVSTDMLIGISYTAISVTLAYLVHRARRDIPFHWIFLAFGLFIVACGATHFMEVVTLWHATYWLSGYVKLVTAAASLATAVVLPSVVPKTLLLVREVKTSDERKLALETANRMLEEELAKRQRAEETLREANQMLEAIFQSSPLAVYALDADGNVRMWNPAAARIFGWSEQETSGRPLPCVPQGHQKECCALRERVMQGHTITDVEGLHQRKDGALINVSISAASLRDVTGVINGVMALTADITERKRADEALQASEAELRALFAAMTDVILVLDEEGRYLKVAPTNPALLYKPGADLVGKMMHEVFPRGQADFFLGRVRQTLATYEPVNVEYSLLINDAETWFAGTVSPISENSVIWVARDITERRRAQEALRESEERYRELVENANDVIYAYDLEGRFTSINRAGERITGYTREEVLRMNIADVVAPEHLAQARRRIAEIVAGGAPSVYELEIIAKDGSRVALEINSRLSTHGSAAAGIEGIARDVTDRKRAAEALRESEERFRLLVEGARDYAIFMLDTEGRVVTWNAGAEQIKGYRAEEIVGHHFSIFYPKEAAERNVPGDELKIAASEGRCEDEGWRLRKDGTQFWANVVITALRNGEGKLLGFSKVTRDVTERKRAEEALRESEERFRLIVEGIRDYAVFMLDTDGRVASWNEGAERLKGYRPEEIIGQHHSVCYTEADVAEGKPGHALKVAATEGRYEDECWMVRKDGSLLLANLIITALRDGEGRLRGFVDVTRDITERKHAEEALRASEELFRGLLELLPVGVYSCDRDGLAKNYNRRAVELWGRAPSLNDTDDRFCGSFKMYWLDGTPVPREQTPMAEVLRTGVEIRGVEAVFERPDHSRITIEIHITPLKDENENVTGAINCFLDITERKRRTEALKESERQLATAQQIAHLGNWEFDFATRTETWSDELYRILGLLPRQVAAGWETFSEYVHPDDRGFVRRIIEQASQNHQPFSYECRLVRPDGMVRTIMTRGEVVTDEAGKPSKLRGVLQDMTELKQAEVERDIERQLLKALIDQLPVGVLVCDMEGRYIKANQRICEIFGTACNELVGMTVGELRQLVNATNPEGVPLGDAEIPSLVAMRTQQSASIAETLITTPGREVRRISANASPVILGGGVPLGSVTVISDVTEQYALQEQLRQSQKMESIGTLAGGVAHDFNNLLTVILGNTQLAFNVVQPGTLLQQRLLEVEKAANRAATLTRQLLAFSRRQRLERKVINLNETINEITKMLRRVIGEDIDVQVKESVRLHPAFADPAQIEQVVMNLAVNARDAMPGGGQLLIETRNVTLDEEYRRGHAYAKPGRYVQIIISDTGTGMDAETRERIFEPFFTTKDVDKGTGLGLSMVYGIIKQHGGLIEVYSELGRGTSFKIYLPVEEEAVKEKEQEDVLPPLRGGAETILIAEDEEALRGLARNILEELGYSVLLAKDGVEAVEVYEANRGKVALALFDIVMPRMGGREAYERISQIGGAMPVIFMTGYSAELVQSEFVKQKKFIEETGATVMQKPYSIETLGRKVREALDVKSKG